MEERRCVRCEYFIGKKEREGILGRGKEVELDEGICHGAPPNYVLPTGNSFGGQWEFPEVQKTDWCGMFKEGR